MRINYRQTRAFLITFVFAFVRQAYSQQQPPQQQAQPDAQQVIIGKVFDTPVPLSNYYFVRSVISVFGNRWGPQPKSPEELEDIIWEQLVLSFEAFRRNIEVSEKEIEQEIDRALKEEKLTFDWKKDKEAFAKWVKEKTNEPLELFQGQLRHYLQLQKLRDQVGDSIKPKVQDREVYERFLDEQHQIEVELVQFPDELQARDFFRNAKRQKKFWEEQKALSPKEFKHPGFVTLIFLIDFWKLPQGDLYKMMKMPVGAVYQPVPIYKGYAVCKILNKRAVDETQFSKSRYSYYDKVEMKKKYEGVNEWIKKLKQDANIQIFKRGG